MESDPTSFPSLVRQSRWLLPVIALLVAFAFQGSRGLYETTEGRYAEMSREMLETGDWVTPQFGYQPLWAKPPVTYWAIASSLWLLGTNTWAVRSVDAVAYLLIVLCVQQLGRAIWDERSGYVSALVYATTPFVAFGVNIVSTDMLVALWAVLMALAYWRALRAVDASGRRRWLLALWLAAALGFLTKGPPALLTLAAIAVFQWTLRRDLARGESAPGGPELPRLLWWPALLCFVVVGFSWYAWVVWQNEGLLTYFVRDEIVNRVATDKFQRNPQWWKALAVYVPPLTVGLVPWILFWPRIGRAIGLTARVSSLREALRRDPAARFLALWLGLPLVVFMLSASRLPFYVLPMVPAFALATGRGLVRSLDPSQLSRRVVAVAVTTALCLVAAKGAAVWLHSTREMRGLADVVKAERGDRGNVIVDHHSEFGGLEFYLDGAVEHIAGLGDEKGRTAPEVQSEFQSRPPGWKIVVVGEAFAAGDGQAGALRLHPGCRQWERWLRALDAHPRVRISQGRYCVVSGTAKS
jgi:4-amino-4-deoxy-L-arabinose transferase-like glycosyltransferase